MRIKKYIVNTMPEAMNMIRQDLGKNAVILNSKQVKTGGIFGFFTKKQIEVIAAVDHTEALSPNKQEQKLEQPEVNQRDISQDLVKEIKDMRELMTTLMSKKDLADVPEEVAELQQYLLSVGFNQSLTAMLVQHAYQTFKNKETEKVGERDLLLELVENKLLQLLKANPTMTIQELAESKYISFLGPTGVGKTTTIAKLAAYLMLNEKKKVAFVTSDTYRIAAVEQLKTYASILNVPVKVIYSEADLKSALDELKDYDIVLMDTAGRNYMQQQYIQEIKALVSAEDQMRKCLVLSLTTSYADNQKIIESFTNLGIDGLILTKQDETKQIGQIANLVYEHKLPIYFVTNGQNVPDDLLLFQPELLSELMMGEDEHE